MKVKRSTIDDLPRNLGSIGGGQNREELCRKTDMREQKSRRQKRRPGMTEMTEARRLKVLEKSNRELEKMLAGSLLRKRVLKIVNAKKQ